MANGLDLFTIAFNSQGLKDFEVNLKNTEKELDATEKEIAKLEEQSRKLTIQFEELANSGEDNLAQLVKTETELANTNQALKEAKAKSTDFTKSLEAMKSQGEYSLLSLKKNFSSLMKTIGLFAFVGATVKKSLDFYEQAEQLDFLAQKTGTTAEKLNELANVTKRFGGTIEGSAVSIENIRTNKEAYTKAGIRIEQDPSQTLENVALKMQKLKTDSAKWDLANSLGLDEATTRMLMQGVDKYREELKRTAKYKLYTKEDIVRMRDYRQIQGDIKDGTNAIFGSIYRMLLPAITAVAKIIRNITDWLTEHEGAVKIVATFVAVAAAIGSVTLAVKLLTGAVAFFTTALGKSMLIWGGIILLITAIIVAIQDFIVFLQGGESLFGQVLKKMGLNVDKVRNNILGFLKDVKQGVQSAIYFLKSLGGFFSDLANKAKAMWDSIPDPLKKLIGLSNPLTSQYTMITTGKEIIQIANSNPRNSIPQGSEASYYNSQSQNAVNTNNSKNISNSKTTHISVGEIKMSTLSNNPKYQAQQFMSALNSIDNGQLT